MRSIYRRFFRGEKEYGKRKGNGKPVGTGAVSRLHAQRDPQRAAQSGRPAADGERAGRAVRPAQDERASWPAGAGAPGLSEGRAPARDLCRALLGAGEPGDAGRHHDARRQTAAGAGGCVSGAARNGRARLVPLDGPQPQNGADAAPVRAARADGGHRLRAGRREE